MLDLLGLDLNSQARGEKGGLTSTRSDFESWDMGDRFRSLITGVSKEDLIDRANELARTDINESQASAISSINTNKGVLDVGDTNIGKNETEAAYRARLDQLQGRVNAAQQYLALPGAKPGDIDPNASATDLIGAASGLRQRRVDEEKAETKQEIIRQENRSDDRYHHENRREELGRKHDLALQRNSSDMQLAIAQMNADLSEKKMEYDRETRRMDKRQQAIATLLGGLGQLGGAFAL
jgi:hypothetical protein